VSPAVRTNPSSAGTLREMMLRPSPRPGFLPLFILLAALLGGAGGAGLTGCTQNISDKDVDKHQVSVAEVRRLQAEQAKRGKDTVLLLIDPRTPEEFGKAHIPGARNIPLATLKSSKDKDLERYKNLIVYGNDPSSAAARAMVKRLMTQGYEDVALLAGGLYQWRVTGGVVEGTEK
jgi:rhodanese-related sulfurtransferase